MSYGISATETGVGIIYSVIAHGTTPLVSHAVRQGNFTEVCRQVLEAIALESNNRLTYVVEDYLFHYISQDGFVYVCISDDDFERSKAFHFLEQLKDKFSSKFIKHGHLSIPNSSQDSVFRDFSREMAEDMIFYSETSPHLVALGGTDVDLTKISVCELELTEKAPLEQLDIEEDSLEEDSMSILSLERLITHHRPHRCCSCSLSKKLAITFLIILIIIIILVIIVVPVLHIKT